MNTQLHPLTRLVHGDDYVSVEELRSRSSEAAEHGDADFYVFQVDLTIRYAFATAAEMFLKVPYEVSTLRVGREDAHHRNETLHGPGDLKVGVKYFPLSGEHLLLGASIGFSLPVGRRNRITRLSFVDHQEAEEIGVNVPDHSHLQLGSGAFDPVIGIEALVRFDDHWILFVALAATIPFYANGDGYRTAPSGALLVGPAFSLKSVSFSLFADLFLAGRDHLDNVAGPGGPLPGGIDVPNTGRFEVALSPAATWWATSALSLVLRLRVPVYTRIEEGPDATDVQLTEPLGISVGFAYDFDPGTESD